MGKTEIITDTDIYREVLLGRVPKAKKFLWLGTSDLKDLHVAKNGSMVPFLEILADLAKKKVSQICPYRGSGARTSDTGQS